MLMAQDMLRISPEIIKKLNEGSKGTGILINHPQSIKLTPLNERSGLIEDVKQSEISMYPFFTPEEVEQKKKRISELEKEDQNGN